MERIILDFRKSNPISIVQQFIDYLISKNIEIVINNVGIMYGKEYTHTVIALYNHQYYCWQFNIASWKNNATNYVHILDTDYLLENLINKLNIKPIPYIETNLLNYSTIAEYIEKKSGITSIEIMNILNIPYTEEKQLIIDNMIDNITNDYIIHNNEFLPLCPYSTIELIVECC